MDPYTTALTATLSGDVKALAEAIDADPAVVSRPFPPGDFTLLHLAAKGGFAEVVALLLRRGAPTRVWPEKAFVPNRPNEGDGAFTPLVQALIEGQWAVATQLAEADRFPDSLWVAVGLDRADLVDACFDEAGGLTEAAGDPGKLQTRQQVLDDALVMAAFRRSRPLVLRLLRSGADPSGRDHWGMTALHHAACGDLELTRLLVGHGADASLRDWQHQGTPLGWAIAWEQDDIADHLLRHARLDILDVIALGDVGRVAAVLSREPEKTRGVTGHDEPLRMAARAGHADIVALLLELGADPAAPALPNGGPLTRHSPLEWGQGHPQVLALLNARLSPQS